MTHQGQIIFVEEVKKHFPKFFNNMKVLEIGSLDLNGSVRSNFKDCEYVGADLGEGKGVDLATAGQLLDFKTHHFDVTVSCNCLEHNPYWLETFTNMIRMTKPGGLVLMTCAGRGFIEHGTTRTSPQDSPFTVDNGWEYYRNLSASDFKSLDMSNWFVNWEFYHSAKSFDLFFIGKIKDDTNESFATEFAKISTKFNTIANRAYGFFAKNFGPFVDVFTLKRLRHETKPLRYKVKSMFGVNN